MSPEDLRRLAVSSKGPPVNGGVKYIKWNNNNNNNKTYKATR